MLELTTFLHDNATTLTWEGTELDAIRWWHAHNKAVYLREWSTSDLAEVLLAGVRPIDELSEQGIIKELTSGCDYDFAIEEALENLAEFFKV